MSEAPNAEPPKSVDPSRVDEQNTTLEGVIPLAGLVRFADFFFQAEDGIRDADVTGVQTCALPISGHAGTGNDVQALFGELLQCFFSHLLVDRRQEGILGFDNGHFRAKTSPYTAQLEANDTGTDDAQTLGYFGKFQGTLGVYNVLAIERSRRNLYRFGTGCQNHVFSFVGFGVAVVVGHLNLAPCEQLAVAVDRRYAVGFEQAGDTASQVLNNAIFAFHHPGNVDAHVFGLNAEAFKVVAGFLKFVRYFEQRLGRDTTHVQTGTTKYLAFAVFAGPGLDTRSFQTQLSGFNGSNVPTGACTNDNNVELIGHNLSCFSDSLSVSLYIQQDTRRVLDRKSTR